MTVIVDRTIIFECDNFAAGSVYTGTVTLAHHSSIALCTALYGNVMYTAAMTFGMGMMFGSRQNSMDEWSTDDEGDFDEDEDEEDEEDEEDDYINEEYYEEYAASIGYGPNGHYINQHNSSPIFPLPPPPPHFEHHMRNGGGVDGTNGMHNGKKKDVNVGKSAAANVSNAANASSNWEPAAKQYYSMNLKAQIHQERAIAASTSRSAADAKGASAAAAVHAQRAAGGKGLDDDDGAEDAVMTQNDNQLTEAEREKKLKAARKRAEKRKKQKERKQREAQSKQESVDNEDEDEKAGGDCDQPTNDSGAPSAAEEDEICVESGKEEEKAEEVVSPLVELAKIAELSDHDLDEYAKYVTTHASTFIAWCLIFNCLLLCCFYFVAIKDCCTHRRTMFSKSCQWPSPMGSSAR